MSVANLSLVTGNDQGQQAGDAGAVSLGASIVSIRNAALDATRRHLGLRFAVTTIPQGSTINSAFLNLTSSHGSVDDLRCDVYGHAIDASDSFETSSGDPTVFQRARTTATVNWVEANCALGATQSIGVASIIQEIVDRSGWAETEITLICIGSPDFTDNYQAHGITGTTPPTLDIDYTAPAGIEGTLSVTLDSLSLASEGAVGIFSEGTLDQTLASLSLVSAGTVETVGGPAVPTITPNTADAYNFGVDTTPTLEFTGDDADAGETLRYHFQSSESNTFPTTPVLTKQNIETDVGTVHANNVSGEGTEDDRPGNSFLGSGGMLDSIHLKLGIQGTPVGTYYIKIYEIQGTFGTDAEPLNAAEPASTPTPGHIAISDGFTVPGDLTTSGIEKTITFSGANRIRLEAGHAYYFILNYLGTGDASNAPFCSVTTAHTYEGDCYNDGQSVANNGYEIDWEVWFKLYEAPFMLDKVSNVDAGFLNTVDAGNLDPFTKNQKISFTVQAADVLETNTYYWRARVIDPFGSNTYSDWTAVRSFIIATDASGVLSVTLASISLSSAGVVDINGALEKALDVLTGSGQGIVDVQGSLTKTLSVLTVSSQGIIDIEGILSKSLEILTLDASGTVGSIPLEGVLSATLELLTLTSQSSVEIQGLLGKTLAQLAIDSQAGVEVQGTLSEVLDQLSQVATGSVNVDGIASNTLETLTLSSEGAVEVEGTASPALEALTLVAIGSVGTIVTEGEVIQTLAALTAIVIGTVPVQALLSKTLEAITLVSVGTVPITASLAETFETLTLMSVGTCPIEGSLSNSLESLLMTGSGTVGTIVSEGVLNQNLESLIIVASGNVPVSGQLIWLLSTLNLVAQIRSGQTAAINLTLQTRAGLGPLSADKNEVAMDVRHKNIVLNPRNGALK